MTKEDKAQKMLEKLQMLGYSVKLEPGVIASIPYVARDAKGEGVGSGATEKECWMQCEWNWRSNYPQEVAAWETESQQLTSTQAS